MTESSDEESHPSGLGFDDSERRVFDRQVIAHLLHDDGQDDDDDEDPDFEVAEEDDEDDDDEALEGIDEDLEEEDEEEEDEENDDDDDEQYHDAQTGYVSVHFEESGTNDEDGVDRGIDVEIRQDQLWRLIFSRHHLTNMLRLHPYGDDDEDDDLGTQWTRRRRRRQPLDPNRFPKVPSEKGQELMSSGAFGADDDEDRLSDLSSRKSIARRIFDREIGRGSIARQKLNNKLLAQNMIPSSEPDSIIHFSHAVYSGQFSDDGNFFFACVKDLKIRMYDTSNPYKWRYYKTLHFPFGQWTLTDASLSPDNKYLAYSSLQSKIGLAPTDPNDLGEPYPLEFGDPRSRRTLFQPGQFGIYSVRFSGDGRELIAGTNSSSICAFDIESRRSLFHLQGHNDDVNAVCFADSSSPHILYSGSDDTTLKVWDRRSMQDSREAGAFVGHTEGVTYIDSKGDGRYILSNGKEQSMKLWDIRMAMSTAEFGKVNINDYTTGYDYRWDTYDDRSWQPHPYDNSLVTFRGHRIQRTLIRCHFSPPGSTNSRYVYSGSADGKVYVWNLNAELVGTVEVQQSTKRAAECSRRSDLWRREDQNWEIRGSSHWKTCVRDAAWHPHAPVIAASSLNGVGMSCGSLSVHSWNDGADDDEGVPEMGTIYDGKMTPIDSVPFRGY